MEILTILCILSLNYITLDAYERGKENLFISATFRGKMLKVYYDK